MLAYASHFLAIIDGGKKCIFHLYCLGKKREGAGNHAGKKRERETYI